MTDPLRASYEAAPYESWGIASTHIDHLRMMARLHGMPAAPPDACRVLELGCASGGNIIPMASEFPGSRFVGIDLTPGQIDVGRGAITDLGLANIELIAMSITDIDDAFGQFDYILCHGVYSWVPSEVQDAILRVCSRNLAPTGIAYVSYNAYPGWHARMAVRQMLMWNDVVTLPSAERLSRARAFLAHVAASTPDPQTARATMLRDSVEVLGQQRDMHLLHEQLEPFNAPCLFSEFAARAASHDLQYVCESSLPETRHVIARLLETPRPEDADLLRGEQFSDFVRDRAFRRTLIAHASVPVNRDLDTDIIRQALIRLRAEAVAPLPEDAARSESMKAFRTPDGVTITTDNPWMVPAMLALGEALPGLMSFPELLAAVRARVAGTPAADLEDAEQYLATEMLRYAAAGMVLLRMAPVHFVGEAGERPVVLPAARHQAPTSEFVTNAFHMAVRLWPIDRALLPYLDGNHDRSDLVALAERALVTGASSAATAAPPLDHASLETAVDQMLARVAGLSLLVA